MAISIPIDVKISNDMLHMICQISQILFKFIGECLILKEPYQLNYLHYNVVYLMFIAIRWEFPGYFQAYNLYRFVTTIVVTIVYIIDENPVP